MRRILRSICRNSRLASALVHRLRYPGTSISASATVDCLGSLVLGQSVVVRDSATLLVPAGSSLELGDRVRIGRAAELQPTGCIRIGADTGIQDRCILLGEISIGRNCILAPNVYASSGNHWSDLVPAAEIRMQDQAVAEGRLQPDLRSAPIRIEEDCWIGINSVIMRGVSIGRGAVVGANSVVTRDVAPYTVVAGTPARPIRNRLDFQPPTAIRSDTSSDYPYFYSGFEPLPATSLLEGNRGPRLALGAFSLALDCSKATHVVLVAGAAAGGHGEIRLGEQVQALRGEPAQVRFALAPTTADRVLFEYSGASGVLLLEARVE